MRSAMRLLPLLLACLLVGQAAAGRVLQQNANQNQFVQIAVTLQGSCAGKGSFPRELRNSARADVQAYFASQPAVAATVQGLLVDECENMQDTDGSALAGFRTSIRFSGLTSFEARQELYRGAARLGCEAGLSPRLYPTILRAISDAGFTLKYNNGDFTNPNGNVGPIPFVNADNCGERPPRPSPTPSPPTPSPSPSPPALTCASFTCAVGSVPNPSAADTPLTGDAAQDQAACCQPFFDCSNIPNSVFDPTSNSCQCTAAGFNIAAFDGADLKACLANTITNCPGNFTTSVRNTNNGIVRCQTPTTPCPEDFNFPLYGGVPATIQQCRSAAAGCTFTGFNVPIRNVDAMVVGCVASTNGACPAPFVGFRAYDIPSTTPGYALQECRNVTACPVYVNENSAYTVRSVDEAGNLRDCLTINFATNRCPENVVGINAPVEVFFSSPLNCGSNTLNCTTSPTPAATFSRTVECRPVAAGCPASQNLRLFNLADANVPTSLTTVECRQPRASCNLVLLANQTNPNEGTYDIRVTSAAGDQLLGCLVAGSNRCPDLFPSPTFNGGVLQSCRPRTDITCAAGQLPGKDATGATVACFAGSVRCGEDDAEAFPVTVRSDAFGPEACLAAGSTCPTNRPFPFYGNLPNPNNAGQVPVLRECWIRPPTNQCTIAGYFRPIKTGEAADTLVGCLSDAATTTQCPITAGFGVAYRDSAGVLQECRPTTQTTCPATGFSTPGRDGSALVACIAVANQCPPNFPVFVRATTTSAIVQCSTPSDCPVGFPFSLRSGNTLQGCLGAQSGTPDCTRFVGYGGPASFDASGAWVGCSTVTTTTCPTGFIGYITVASAANSTLVQCRAALAAGSTCTTSVVSSGSIEFRVNLRNEANAVVGCASLTGNATQQVCPEANPTYVRESLSAVVTDCLTRDLTACPGIVPVTGDTPRNFPLYGDFRVRFTVNPPTLGQPRILGCIVKPSGNTCTGQVPEGQTTGFTAEVFNSQFNTDLVGCIATTGTVCPAAQPMVFLTSSATIDACRPMAASCRSSVTNDPIQPGYTVDLRNAAAELQGCLSPGALGSPLGGCPANDVARAYNFPLPLGGPTAELVDGRPVLVQCRTWPLVNGAAERPTDCNAVPNFPVPVYNSTVLTETGALMGCLARLTSCPTGVFPLLDASGGAIQQCRVLSGGTVTCDGNWNIEVADVLTANATIDTTNTVACLQTAAAPQACQAIRVRNNFTIIGDDRDFTVFVQTIDAVAQNPARRGTLERCIRSTATCGGEFGLRVTLDSTPGSGSATNPLAGCVGNSTVVSQTVCNAWTGAFLDSTNPPVGYSCFP